MGVWDGGVVVGFGGGEGMSACWVGHFRIWVCGKMGAVVLVVRLV